MEKRNLNRTEKQKQDMLHAIELTGGNIKQAASNIGITARIHYMWIKEDREYGENVERVRDICFRNAKEQLMVAAMKKIEEGNTAVLNKMLGIFYKNFPLELQQLSKYNNLPFKTVIKYVGPINEEVL